MTETINKSAKYILLYKDKEEQYGVWTARQFPNTGTLVKYAENSYSTHHGNSLSVNNLYFQLYQVDGKALIPILTWGGNQTLLDYINTL